MNSLAKQTPRRRDYPRPPRLQHKRYKIGWICALEKELAVSEAMLDEIHQNLPTAPNDTNTYTLGSIAGHCIVIACLPAGQIGPHIAAIVGANMTRTFQFIEKWLLVGIGGGVPDPIDVRLGDVVVSDQVIQYDLGKTIPGGKFHRTSIPTGPPQALMTAVSTLQAAHRRAQSQITSLIDDMLGRHSPQMREYARPKSEDVLFQHSYDHVVTSEDPNVDCQCCDLKQKVLRPGRPSADPVVHLGKIASGSSVIRDGKKRQELAKELGVICFEMEAAGLMSHTSCLVIRGICDYADSHKNKIWQEYAAATAAAYAKELLLNTPSPAAGAEIIHRSLMSNFDPRPRRCRRQQLLDLLNFEKVRSRIDDIKPALHETCRWFLKEPLYLTWLDRARYQDHHGFIWIRGKPGAGKSTLMKFLYSHAKTTWGQNPNVTVAAFFFNARGTSLEKSTEGLYRSLLFQILTAIPDLTPPQELTALQESQKAKETTWTLPVLQALFQYAILNIGQRGLICFIDGLDECDEKEIQIMTELLQEIGSLAAQKSRQLYICLSSRHYPRIEIEPCLRLTLEDQKGHSNDIRQYVHSKLDQRYGRAVAELATIITMKAAGMFVWVVFVVQSLRKEFQRGDILAIKSHIQRLPSELCDLFKDILSRDQKNLQDLLLCIQWISFAKRPLTSKEFFFAMQSSPHRQPSGTLKGWDTKHFTEEHMNLFVSSTSKGLAEVKVSDKPTVQFIHESVRDFLIRDGGIQELWPQHAHPRDFEATSHDCLKLCCAFFLRADISSMMPFEEAAGIWQAQSGTLPTEMTVERVRAKFPFLQYAVENMFYHSNASHFAIPQADFFEGVNLKLWISLHNMFEGQTGNVYSLEANRAYIFSANNWVELLRLALGFESDIWSPKETFGHPLIVSSANGNEAAVKLLLATEGTTIQPPESSGRMLQARAVADFNKGLVDLPARISDPNVKVAGYWGRTVLSWTSENGIDQVITVLLNSGKVYVNSTDYRGRTALSWAAGNGHENVVALLLDIKGINVNITDWSGCTALFWAAGNGHENVVALLLAMEGISVNAGDRSKITALTLAAGNGHDKVVALLLDMDEIDVNARDRSNVTALSWAAANGHKKVVDLLLKNQKVDINSRDWNGRTALSWAAAKGYHQIVTSLLDIQRVDINSRDWEGRTALSWAAANGHYHVVTSLLDIQWVDVNSRDWSGRTVLSWAAGNGHQDIVRLLLDCGTVDINSKDQSGRTALSWAAGNGHHNAVRLLLNYLTVDINLRDHRGRTALSWAAENNHHHVVRLFEHGPGDQRGFRYSLGR